MNKSKPTHRYIPVPLLSRYGGFAGTAITLQLTDEHSVALVGSDLAAAEMAFEALAGDRADLSRAQQVVIVDSELTYQPYEGAPVAAPKSWLLTAWWRDVGFWEMRCKDYLGKGQPSHEGLTKFSLADWWKIFGRWDCAYKDFGDGLSQPCYGETTGVRGDE